MSTTHVSGREPNPAIVFETLNAYQMPAALKAAIELDIFTHIGRGERTADSLARAAGSSGRGIRILCDYLVIVGFLTKERNEYSLSPDSAAFLDRNSPAYLGSVTRFLLDPRLISPYLNLAQVVRNGRTSLPDQGTVSPDNPIWVEFAREMAPLLRPAAAEIAELVAGEREMHVLDIASGHGLFGIAIAQRNANARVTALDWPNVLAVASENAAKAGVAARHSTIPGDAFEVEFGGTYDLVLVTNFFHHFDPSVCEKLMRKILASLAAGGRCVTLDFVPNADRVSPPGAAVFAMMMLGTTVSGDAYTFDEYEAMFRNAGFASSEVLPLTRSAESLIISRKD